MLHNKIIWLKRVTRVPTSEAAAGAGPRATDGTL